MNKAKLLRDLGLTNFRDKVILYKLIDLFEPDVSCKDFTNKIRSSLGDYSNVRKQVKKIITDNEKNIVTILDIEDKEKLTSKVLIQNLVKRSTKK